MEDRLYPVSLNELDGWSKGSAVGVEEAKRRLIQFAILSAIGSSSIRMQLVFKGGNALRFAYGNRRSTLDLDFTATGEFPADDETVLRARLDEALRTGASRFGLKMKCQRIRRNPPSLFATHPTYEVSVGFQLPGDRYFTDFEKENRQSKAIVSVEISINDLVCESSEFILPDGSNTAILVATLDDILAEKMRALLQQPIRNRNRPQDVYDIAAMILAKPAQVHPDKITVYLRQKAAIRHIVATKSAFRNPVVAERAASEYVAKMRNSLSSFPAFDVAWREVESLVARLGISDE